MVKEKAILTLMIGELYWEFFRFAPHIIWKRQKQLLDPSIKFIICSREDRFDIYGSVADILVPLRIDGDNDRYIQNGFRLNDYPQDEYDNLVNNLYRQFEDRYDIIDFVKAPMNGKEYVNKNYYSKHEMRYVYLPREENNNLINKHVPQDKPIVVLAPRFRKKLKRNWINWEQFYNDILNSDLSNHFLFVICGKKPDYIEDKRFFDINNIPLNEHSSLIGLTIELLKKSILTVGSQSAIPNISSLLKTEVLEWGDQKDYHVVTYNIFSNKITYIEDPKYNISSEIIMSKMKEILEKRRTKNE